MSIINELIRSQLARDGSGGGRGTIVPLHCAQMREYGSRGGHVQFDCPQDDDINSRGIAISKWYKSNGLAAKMDYIFDVFVCWGEILWLILPLDNGDYWVEFFQGGLKHTDPQFKVYYKNGGREIESAVIRYSYEKDNTIGTVGMGMPSPISGNVGGTSTSTRWIKLIITADTIVTIDSGSEPDLRVNYQGQYFGNDVKIAPNPFAPVLPIALSINNPQQTGKQGTGDFHVFSHMIELHEQRLACVDENLHDFGNPSLVTTRSAQEVIDTATTDIPNTWASNQGYRDGVGDGFSGSSDKSLVGRIGGRLRQKIKKIIGNVAQDERFGYIQVDPVSSDLTNYIRSDRELIHWCLGGVDPIGISTSATFGEIKTLFGRVQNTADKKAGSLFNGLGKLFAIAVANEEQKFKANFILAIAQSKLAKSIPDLANLTDEQVQNLYQMYRSGDLDKYQISFNSAIGLPPMGDRTVVWRHTREVHKPSTRDLLDLSIVGRNLREDGLNQEFTMGKLYPELSPKEIQAATTGFSPRVVENQLNGLNSLLQFYQASMGVPGSQNPNIPLAIELGLSELIANGVNSLKKELNYGKPVYTAADAASTPASLSEFISRAAASTNPTGEPANPDGANSAIAANIPTAGTN
jgi:hypothetical protein